MFFCIDKGAFRGLDDRHIFENSESFLLLYKFDLSDSHCNIILLASHVVIELLSCAFREW